MAGLSAEPETIRTNLERVQNEIAAACERAGRTADEVTICAATKYVDAVSMKLLKAAGVRVAAENRLQDMLAKQSTLADDFEWHFIGAVQSRKAVEIAANVSTLHSLATESARDKLSRAEIRLPRVLVQVNVSGEESKAGVPPELLDEFLGGCDFDVAGLMTMPPLDASPDAARPYFRKLAELAAERGMAELSMGTSQDFLVAVEEGATLVRVGSVLFSPPAQ